jgi:DNA transposition AAA+ family ATPase
MRDHFFVSKSVRIFEDGIDHINHKLKGVERMLLATGEPGLGKTEAAIHYCAMNGAVLIRTLELMSGSWLLRTIVSELGGAPYYRADRNFELIKELLASKPRTIIFDEVDRFARKPEILETLRDIHDTAHCPMVFVGEEMADKKLMNNRRLYRRFVETVRFEKLDTEGVENFLAEVSEVKYQADAIEQIARDSNGKISEIVTAIHHAEAWAKRNNEKSVSAKDLK